MFSHGIIAGLLFAVVGRMVYDRTHTRDLAALRSDEPGPGAAVCGRRPSRSRAWPRWACPGFSGFVAELQVLIGAWHAFPTCAALAGVGILVGVAYTLRALQKAFLRRTRRPSDGTAAGAHPLPPISVPERLGAVLLIAATLVIGLYPQLLLDLIGPASICRCLTGCCGEEVLAMSYLDLLDWLAPETILVAGGAGGAGGGSAGSAREAGARRFRVARHGGRRWAARPPRAGCWRYAAAGAGRGACSSTTR